MTIASWAMRVSACTGWAMIFMSTSVASGIDGSWRGIVNGQQTVLTLRSEGQTVSGIYAEGALQLEMLGQFDGDRLQARVREPTSGMEIAQFDARLRGYDLAASIDAANPITGERKSAQASFRRAGAAASPGDVATNVPGALDRELIGTWVNEKMINSGGANFASFSTVMTMSLGADGRVQQWSRSVGGGGDWSYDSGAGELHVGLPARVALSVFRCLSGHRERPGTPHLAAALRHVSVSTPSRPRCAHPRCVRSRIRSRCRCPCSASRAPARARPHAALPARAGTEHG
jgi:hypothetical protein